MTTSTAAGAGPAPYADPAAALDALVRTRADTSGADVPVWWRGDVYAVGPGLDHTHLFGFEGANVGRLVATDDGYDFLAREVAYYLDPRSREVLDEWDNPFTGERVAVAHVTNDPVNQRWATQTRWGPFRLPTTDLGERVCFNLDIPLAYPSPLSVAEFPESSADDTYRALELFQFFAAKADLADASLTSVPCELSWSRVSPWLPWMRMGQRPGGLVFHTRGAKLGSWDEVPAEFAAQVARRHPEYATAPGAWSEPNETSWTWFRRHHADVSAPAGGTSR